MGNVGVMMSIFTKKGSTGPPSGWTDPMSYPAISGISIYSDVTFTDFDDKCGEVNLAVINNVYNDIVHPMKLSNIQLNNVLEKNKVRSGSTRC